MVSIAADGRSGMSVTSSTGTALRAARVASASARPLSSTGGWMPRARVRSSAIASMARRCASSTSWVTRARSSRRGVAGASPWPGRASWPGPRAAPGCRRAGPARCRGAGPPSRPRRAPGSPRGHGSARRARAGAEQARGSATRSASVIPCISHGAASSRARRAGGAGTSRREVDARRPRLAERPPGREGQEEQAAEPAARGDGQPEDGERQLQREVGARPPGGRVEDPPPSQLSLLCGRSCVDRDARLGGQLGDPGAAEAS